MTSSREHRASCLNKLCEYAARNLTVDFQDTDDPHVVEMCDAYDKFASKVRYLVPNARAAWSKEFERVMCCSSSMRIVKLDMPCKEGMRGFSGVCMACGTKENNCRYAIDLAGSYDAKAWLKGPQALQEEYNKFVTEYDSVFEPTFLSKNKKAKALPLLDKGRYVVGETCLRKARLVFQLQTLMLEGCYGAERIVEQVDDYDSNGELPKNQLYTDTPERAEELVNMQDCLELAVADPKRHVPPLKIDTGFWNIVDTLRKSINKQAQGSLVSARAWDHLGKNGPNEAEHDEPGPSSRPVDDSPPRRDAPRTRARRNASAAVESTAAAAVDADSGSDAELSEVSDSEEEDDDYEDTDDESPPPKRRRSARGPQGRRHAAKKKKKKIEDSDEEEEEEEEEAPAPAPRSTGRVPSASATSMAGVQRRDGTLPSRRSALLALMQMQVECAQQDRHDHAAVCSHAILTIQELIQQCDERAHTRDL